MAQHQFATPAAGMPPCDACSQVTSVAAVVYSTAAAGSSLIERRREALDQRIESSIGYV